MPLSDLIGGDFSFHPNLAETARCQLNGEVGFHTHQVGFARQRVPHTRRFVMPGFNLIDTQNRASDPNARTSRAAVNSYTQPIAVPTVMQIRKLAPVYPDLESRQRDLRRPQAIGFVYVR